MGNVRRGADIFFSVKSVGFSKMAQDKTGCLCPFVKKKSNTEMVEDGRGR